VIEQKLGIDPAFKPIKQKERRYTPETHETIQVEVNKLLETEFIKPVDYPRWLANPVLVEKTRWILAHVYRLYDFNKLLEACPRA
jgi:hypothetical protein